MKLLFVALLQQIGTLLAFLPLEKRYRLKFGSSHLIRQAYPIHVDPATVLETSLHELLDSLILSRSEARWKGDYKAADCIRHKMDDLLLPDGLSVSIADIPRNAGGGSNWTLIYDLSVDNHNRSSVLNLAHAALGMVVSSSERGQQVAVEQLEDLVEEAKSQLLSWQEIYLILGDEDDSEVTFDWDQILSLVTCNGDMLTDWCSVETDLRGRKPADAAFWFALAGVKDTKLFELLTNVCTKEIRRFGGRPSCRAKDITSMVDRLAAAGVRSNEALDHVVSAALRAKGVNDFAYALDLHSDSCALMIWKFSTRQRKQRAFLQTAAKHWEARHGETTANLVENTISDIDWNSVFQDATKPLVIDVGCGMGVSVIGLASSANDSEKGAVGVHRDWSAYNFVGVDLSQVGIAYARGITERWKLGDRVAFVVNSAENLLKEAMDYPGPIELVMIQFPTPYRLVMNQGIKDKRGGNSQLPSTALDGFMVSPKLFELVSTLMNKDEGAQSNLLLQSNCEDVAVYMRSLGIEEAMFRVVPLENEVETVQGSPTQRTLNWIGIGGERAEGFGWSADPLLPPKGRTETEIACILNQTPVHRCQLEPGVVCN